jgi:carbonic anhydrase
MDRALLLPMLAASLWMPLPAQPAIDPDKILSDLLAGNQRHMAGRLSHPNQSAARRAEVAKGQHPVAAVLSCSDSRVPPELVFDRGLGDLFVVRVAGNIADNADLGSLEYAAEHLDIHLAIVLGHKRCGAVDAAVKGGEAPGKIKSLVDAILPAVSAAKGMPGDLLDNAIRMNATQVAARLRTEPMLAHKVRVVAAYYDLDTGKITILP